MKRIAILAAFGAAMTLAPLAQADHGWGLYGTYWNTKDGQDEWGGGFRLAVDFIPHVFADLRVSYFDDLIGSSVAKIEDIPIEIGLMGIKEISDRVDVYGGGGLSIHLLDGHENIPGTPRETINPDDELGIYFVLGIESLFLAEELATYHVNGVTLFAEATYRFLTVDDATLSSDGTRLQDAELDGLGFNLGFTIRW